MATASDGSLIIDVDVNSTKAERELQKITQAVDRVERRLTRKTIQQSAIAEKLKNAKENALATEKEIERLQNLIAELEEGYKKIGVYVPTPDLDRARVELEKQKKLLEQQDRITERLDQQYTRITDEVIYENNLLEQQKNKAGEVAAAAEQIGGGVSEASSVTEQFGKRIDKLTTRIKKLASRVFVFSVITSAFRSARTWVGDIVKVSDEASTSVSALKAALLTLVQPLVNVVIPAFTKFVNALTAVVVTIAKVFSAIMGTSYEASKDAAENLKDEQDALNGVSSAANKATKSLASFDEINQLSGATSSSVSTSTSTSVSAEISADFSALEALETTLPEWLENLTTDIVLTIENLRLNWDEESFWGSDLWDAAINGIMGFIIGDTFAGFSGGAISATVGILLGLSEVNFVDKIMDFMTEHEELVSVLNTILGAIAGGVFGGFDGAVLGLVISGLISFNGLNFAEADEFGDDEASSGWEGVMEGILGAMLGAKFGGIEGAGIGFLLGTILGLTKLSFEASKNGDWDSGDTWKVVIDAILAAAIGTLCTGLNPLGTAVGLLLGVIIGFNEALFDDDSVYDKTVSQSTFRTVFWAILGIAAGTFFGGPVGSLAGGLLGLGIGMLISTISVAFDKTLDEDVKAAAGRFFASALTAILGAVIGFMFGGIFGGVVGGVIGLALGLAISFSSVSVDKSSVDKAKSTIATTTASIKSAAQSTAGGTSTSIVPNVKTYSSSALEGFEVPALAQGAVIPPNREFMAVLGDQRNGYNLEAPAALIKQMVTEGIAEAGGGSNRNITVIMQVDRRELGRVVYQVNNEETQRVGVSLAEVTA